MIEFKIGDRERGLSFGMNTIKIITDLTGIKPLEEIFGKLKDQDLTFVMTFFYACALHYAKSKKQDIDFTEFDTNEWMDELGLERVKEMIGQLFQTFNLKNYPAPPVQEMAGLTDQQ
jgi:hypothetical protein